MAYKKSTNIGWGSLKVGIVISLVVVLMFWASFTGGGTSIFDSKGKFVCYFENVNGLVSGSPVWLSGVEVGNVKSIDFVNEAPDKQVKVVCRVKKEVWDKLTANARVQLGTIGFLGDKYVEVIPGVDGGAPIVDMDVVPTRDAGSAEAVFKKAETSLDDVRHTVLGIDTLLWRINRGEGTLGKMATEEDMYNNLTELLAKLTKLTASLQENQERIISSMESTANSVSSLSNKVDQNTGTIGRLVNDPQLYDNLAASTAKLDTILLKINMAEGSLGMMVNDTSFYSEVTNLMQRTNNLITDIQKDPRKYFKFSVF